MPNGALTLSESAKNMSPGGERAIIETYATSYRLIEKLPLRTRPNGIDKWNLETELPYAAGSGKRNLGANFTSTFGQTHNFNQEAKIYGGRVEIDNYIVKTNPGTVGQNRASQIKAQAREFTIDTFEGTGGTAFRGVDDWLNSQPEFVNQTVIGNNAGTASAGATLSGDLLDRLIDKCATGAGDACFVGSQAVMRKMFSLNRGNTVAEYNRVTGSGEVGDRFRTYGGIELVTLVDGKGIDLLSTTLGDGNSSTLYLMVFGEEMYSGMQVSEPIVRMNLQDETSSNFSVMEWYANSAPKAIRSVGRIQFVSES